MLLRECVSLILHPVRNHSNKLWNVSQDKCCIWNRGGGVGGIQKKRNSMICEEEIREGFVEERPLQLVCKSQVWFEEAVIQETDHPTVTPMTNGEHLCTFSLGLQYEFQAFVGYSTGNGKLLRAGTMIFTYPHREANKNRMKTFVDHLGLCGSHSYNWKLNHTLKKQKRKLGESWGGSREQDVALFF